MTPAQLRDVGRIVLTGCGTALHAAMVGEYLIEQLAHIPTEVEYASEFRHRNTPMTQRHARVRDQPKRRNGGHARRVARKPAQRLSHTRHLQQCREHDRARKRRRRLHARRAGDRRGRDEIVHVAGRHPHADRVASWPDAASFDGGRKPHHRSARRRCRNRSRKCSTSSDQIKAIAKKYADVSGMSVLRPAIQFPDRARRRAEDEGNHLPVRRRSSERRAQARHHRAGAA